MDDVPNADSDGVWTELLESHEPLDHRVWRADGNRLSTTTEAAQTAQSQLSHR